MSAVGDIVVNFKATVGGLLGPIATAQRAVTGFASTAGGVLGRMGTIAGGILAATGITKLGSAIVGVGKSMVMGNADMERYRTSLTVLLGSVESADKMLADLKAFAAKTPFELPQLVQSGQQLLAFGFKAEQIIPMLTDIGDAASASPKGMAQAVESITRSIGQMQAKGKVSAEEMMQLTEAGIPAWDLLAKGIGKSTAETMKLAEAGKLSAKDAIPALLQGMRGKYGGMMEKQSGTFAGLLSTLKDTAGTALAKIGEPLFAAMKSELSAILQFFDSPSASQWIDSIRSGFATAIEWQAKMRAGLVDIWEWATPYAVAFWDWLKSTAIGTWTILIGWAERFGGLLGEVWTNALATAEAVWDAMGNAAEWIGQQWQSLFGETVSESVGGVSEAIGNFVETALDYLSLFTTDWGLTWEWIKTTAALKLVELADSSIWLWDNFTNAMSAAFDAMVARMPYMLGSMKEAFLAIVDLAVGAGRGIWEALKAGMSGDWSGVLTAMKDEMSAAMDSAMARVTDPNSDTQKGIAAAMAAWDKKRSEMAGRDYDSPEAKALREQQAGIVGQMQEARNKAREAAIPPEIMKPAVDELSDDLLDWFPATVEGWMQDASDKAKSPSINIASGGKAADSPAAAARGSAAAWSTIAAAANGDVQGKQLAQLERIAGNTDPARQPKPKQMRIG